MIYDLNIYLFALYFCLFVNVFSFFLALKRLGKLSLNDCSIEKWDWVKEVKGAVDGCLEKLSDTAPPEIQKTREISNIPVNPTSVLDGTTTNEIQRKTPKQKVPHVMLSYNHSTQPIVKNLNAKLKVSGIKTWVDFDDMTSESLNIAMAEAVENSYAVIICYSLGYNRSVHCRKEAEYAADIRNKPIFYVKAEKYEPDGWLGILKANAYHYDLTKPEKLEIQTEKLIGEIKHLEMPIKKEQHEEALKAEHIQPLKETLLPMEDSRTHRDTVDSTKNADFWMNWTENDVQNWLLLANLPFLQKRYKAAHWIFSIICQY